MGWGGGEREARKGGRVMISRSPEGNDGDVESSHVLVLKGRLLEVLIDVVGGVPCVVC